MSLYDICIPDPPLECPRCTGALTGWETRNEGSCFFVWRQGFAAPIRQNVDPEIAARPEHLATLRLPRRFRLQYGGCRQCGYMFHGDVLCSTDHSQVWRTAELNQPISNGVLIDDGWIQCPECCDAFELIPQKRLYICPSCRSFVRIAPDAALSA